MSEFVLEAQNLGKTFTGLAQPVTVFSGLNLQVARGQSVAIVGASGSGKSTLLQLLGGLDKPSEGKVILDGQDLSALDAASQGAVRNAKLGFVYQLHHLLPEFSALDNVAMPLWIRRMNPNQVAALAKPVLERLGLGARLEHRPAELSGGERQRVAVARALVTQPAVLLADEPTGNLDGKTASSVFEQMLELAALHQSAVIVVTHDESLAARCSRVVRLQKD